jgi:Ca-activated chloride channel family protein
MFTQKKYPHKLLWIALLTLIATGCGAAQDASKSYSRAVINRGAIVPAESVRVHEYLNYYDQRFPEPIDQPLGLDLRLGNPRIPTSGGEVWLQIGLQARGSENESRTPLNLALVLDCSGSMGDRGKMAYLKQSLMVFLESLQPDDLVAIVAYSDSAWVVRKAQPVGDGAWIRRTIERLVPGGSTNLHDGMMLGFEEVDRNFDVRRNNRVILLTDGIANVGVIDPDRIAAEALSYNQDGIYLSTIGLGLDMNDQLLSTLARQGRGAYHFVDSAQEMDKVFRVEVEGLVERVANDVWVSIKPASGVQLTSVTGFEGSPPSGGAEIVLQDMGAGDSQVLMARLQVSPSALGARPLAEVTLSYSDVFAQRSREISNWVSAQALDMGSYDPFADIEVRRNATIVLMAEALKVIDQLFNEGRYEEAWEIAYGMECELRTMAALAGDPQMVEDADLFHRYQMTLVNALGYDPAEIHIQPTTFPSEDQPQRWGDPAEESLPTIELDE